MIDATEFDDLNLLLAAAVEKKEKIFVLLQCGTTYFGKAGNLKQGFLVIQEIGGKEFYDAYIRLDHICSVEVKARES